MKKATKKRLIYALIALVIFVIEVLIALYVDDKFIRPFGGDILVVILIACIVRIFSPDKIRLLALWVFIFAVMVETAQHFDIVSLLGLQDIPFFVILIGNSFSFIDIICYAAGCLIFFIAELIFKRKEDKNA